MDATKRHTQMQCRTSTSEFPRPAVLGWYRSGVRREIRDLAKKLAKVDDAASHSVYQDLHVLHVCL